MPVDQNHTSQKEIFNTFGQNLACAMRHLIERTIELLKLQVRQNLDKINLNQSRIKELFEKQNSDEQKKSFELFYAENKKLLTENNEFINLQLNLITFLEKNKDSAALNDGGETLSEQTFELPSDEALIFDMTVQGELAFDEHHPLFLDEDFFNKLMRYYTVAEDYERCSELLVARSAASKNSESRQPAG